MVKLISQSGEIIEASTEAAKQSELIKMMLEEEDD